MKKNYINYLIILGMSLIYFIVLVERDVFYNAHDLIFHTSNIISMAENITLSTPISSKILPFLVNNLGYGVNLFYPSLPHLIGAYIYKISNNINLTMYLLNFLIISLSGVSMYRLTDKIFKSKEQALLTSITYVSFPYLFADVFIRCALNESFLLFIIPLILLGIHYLIDDGNKLMFYILFTFGYVFSINSHLVLSIYLTMVLLIYFFKNRKKVFKKEIIKHFFVASVFILLLTLNFTVPLLEHYKLGIYNIFNIEYTNKASVEVVSVLKYLLPVRHIDIPLYIPIVMIIGLVILFIKRKEIEKTYRNILLGMSVILIFSLFLATNEVVWNIIPNILRNIQFGWRMTLFVAIAVSILFGYTINFLKNDLKKVFLIGLIIIFSITNFITSQMTFKVEEDSLNYLSDITYVKWAQEYLPVSASSHALELKFKKEDLGNDAVTITKNNIPDMEFSVDGISEDIEIEFPRIYYLGYKLIDDSGYEYDLSISSIGLLKARIDKDGEYKLEYVGTKFSNIANVVTIISLFAFILYLFMLKFNKRRDK